MGGFFAVASKTDCVSDLYFGVDYHSHLGSCKGGIAVFGDSGIQKAIHNIAHSPFRTKFAKEIDTFHGKLGIGCISDRDSQPLYIRSHLGSYAIVTVGHINNKEEILKKIFMGSNYHFFANSDNDINSTELVAAIMNQKGSIEEGLSYVQEVIKGSMSVIVMKDDGIYAMRDKFGRTPVILGKKEDAYCVTFESTAFLNLGYKHVLDFGPGEIIWFDENKYKSLRRPNKKMKICSFLWVYYGYPTSEYEGKNVEIMRNNCGRCLARRKKVDVDYVASIPDSGIPNAIGYANEACATYARPFIKYTPTWPRSFLPSNRIERELIAKMKLIPIKELIDNKKLLLVDDSIVRGNQLGGTAKFLYESGAKEVHVRPACPPIIFGCKYLNFSRSSNEMELVTRRIISELEGDQDVSFETLQEYSDCSSKKYRNMIEGIRKELDVTTLDYARISELVSSIGLDKSQLCTYCMDGEE